MSATISYTSIYTTYYLQPSDESTDLSLPLFLLMQYLFPKDTVGSDVMVQINKWSRKSCT